MGKIVNPLIESKREGLKRLHIEAKTLRDRQTIMGLTHLDLAIETGYSPASIRQLLYSPSVKLLAAVKTALDDIEARRALEAETSVEAL